MLPRTLEKTKWYDIDNLMIEITSNTAQEAEKSNTRLTLHHMGHLRLEGH